MAKKDGKYIEFNEHEFLDSVAKSREADIDRVVSEIDNEEAKEGRMSEEQIELEKKGNIQQTVRNKHKFIDEIKGGLGKTIKEKPMEIKVVTKEKTFKDKMKDFFTKF